MNDNSKKGVKLYIKYVPISFTNDSLKNLLSQFGVVLHVHIDLPPFKVTKFGYAFANVATMRDALNIIENVNKKPPLNLLVELAKDRNRTSCPVQEYLQKRDEISSPNFFQLDHENGMMNGELPNGHSSLNVEKKPSPKIAEESTSNLSRKTKLKNCVKCCKSATKRCSVCKAYYCSTDCQFDDWFEHHQFKCRNPPPLEEAINVEICDNECESKSSVTDSTNVNIKENEIPSVNDETDSSYSFSRLLKGESVTSNKQEITSYIAERKGVSFSQSVEKRTEKDIPSSDKEERLLESSLNKVASNNMRCTETFVKKDTVIKNLMNMSLPAKYKQDNDNGATKPKKLLKKDIPTEKLKSGSEHNVFPTYLDGDTLYIQLASDRKAAMIREMTFTMRNFCSTAPLPETLQLGEVVCCYISLHDTWYRAEVLEIKSGKILVHIFDFGNEEMVHIKDVRICDPMFKNFPVMAIPVKPICNCSQDVLRESLNVYIEESNPILMIVVEENPLKVELMDVTGQKRIIPDQILQDEVPNLDKQTSTENSKAVELLKSGEVKPSMPFYDECPCTSLPIKDGVEIFILNPDNPLNIFAVPKESLIESYEGLESISTEMNEYCNSLSNTHYEPEEGEICIAKFSSDDLWYRAACIFKNKDSATVVFVDYGNQEEVSFKNICQMVDKFLAVPLIALHCRIKGFTLEEVSAGGAKLIEKLKDLLPPNSSHIVNVIDKCDASQIYGLEFPSLDIEGLKKGILC